MKSGSIRILPTRADPGTGADPCQRAQEIDDKFHHERLEFLGDRVLGLTIADLLHRSLPVLTRASCHFASMRWKGIAEIADELRPHELSAPVAISRN
ncbi:MAG: hypothetical protein R3D29_00910 [Nitratireductor sp.]